MSLDVGSRGKKEDYDVSLKHKILISYRKKSEEYMEAYGIENTFDEKGFYYTLHSQLIL